MLIASNIIAGKESAEGNETMCSVNPVSQDKSSTAFPIATTEEINSAATIAYEAWHEYSQASGKRKAQLLRTIADEIEDLGDQLVHTVIEESGLPEGRVRGERGRTCNQLRLFADLVEEGSWINATIDEAMPNRTPLPRTDIRKTSFAIGPVAVFTASNFPLAFSTAGGDTASALAAGCPVVVKAHPSHLKTNALISNAITVALKKCELHPGVFSTIIGGIIEGETLIQHPQIKAVGFTGSYKGGKAIFDLANSRPEPIPVYSEMGSINPIFILQEKIKADAHSLASMIAGSVNLGAGQFCTNPGLLILEKTKVTNSFLSHLKYELDHVEPAMMLNQGIHQSYKQGKNEFKSSPEIQMLLDTEGRSTGWKGHPAIATIEAYHFLQNKKFQDEVFGPFTLVVLCENHQEMIDVANFLQGQLSVTLMGTETELKNERHLLQSITKCAGRVIFNQVPTGVEVCHAMHHGGPFPATTNSLFTSVGTDAIRRFVRPVTYQNTPEELLPEELKTGNPLNIWRKVNGKLSQS